MCFGVHRGTTALKEKKKKERRKKHERKRKKTIGKEGSR